MSNTSLEIEDLKDQNRLKFDYYYFSDYIHNFDYSTYYDYFDYSTYYDYFDYSNYFGNFDYSNYFGNFDYSNYYDYIDYSNYFSNFDYSNYFSNFDYSNYYDYFDYSNYDDYFDYSNYYVSVSFFPSNYYDYLDYSNYYHNDSGDYFLDYNSKNFTFVSLFGDTSSGDSAFFQFVVTCLLICVGLPLALGVIYGLSSLVRNGEVVSIYAINLLISDISQFCCMITEVACFDLEIKWVFGYIYNYSLLASIGFMVCIALDRYLAVVWDSCKRTIKTSVKICVLIWILPVACVLTERFSDWNTSVVVSSLSFLLPLPLLIFFMIATLKALPASTSVPADEKRRIAEMLIVVLLTYLLFFLPAIILNVFRKVTDYIPHDYLIFVLAPFFFKVSPLADVVLYFLMKKEEPTHQLEISDLF